MFSNWDTGIMQQQVWITLSILSPGIKYMLLVIAIFVCHVFFCHVFQIVNNHLMIVIQFVGDNYNALTASYYNQKINFLMYGVCQIYNPCLLLYVAF